MINLTWAIDLSNRRGPFSEVSAPGRATQIDTFTSRYRWTADVLSSFTYESGRGFVCVRSKVSRADVAAARNGACARLTGELGTGCARCPRALLSHRTSRAFNLTSRVIVIHRYWHVIHNNIVCRFEQFFNSPMTKFFASWSSVRDFTGTGI